MSAKLDIFNDIVTKIEAIVDTDSVKVINTVELWNSQLENEGEEIPFNFPAVFIEFSLIPWTSTNQQSPTNSGTGDIVAEQKGIDSLVTLHIAFSQLENETVSFPLISPIIDEVYFAVHKLSGDFYSQLLRVEERQDTDHDRVIDWQMDFLTTLFQCGENDETLTQIAGGVVKPVITVDLDIEPDTQTGIRTGPEQP